LPSYSNDNLAYDFARFEKRKPTAIKKEKMKQPAAKENDDKLRLAHRRNTVAAFKIMCAVLTAGIVVAMFLYSNAQISELNSTIANNQKKLTQLQSEEVRLNVEFEQRVSIASIDTYIQNELKLVKYEKHQIHYIDLSEGDKLEFMQDKPWDLFGGIKTLFAGD